MTRIGFRGAGLAPAFLASGLVLPSKAVGCWWIKCFGGLGSRVCWACGLRVCGFEIKGFGVGLALQGEVASCSKMSNWFRLFRPLSGQGTFDQNPFSLETETQ